MLSIKEAKAQARILRTFLAEQDVQMPHGVCLEAIARLAHHRNWATYLAETKQHDALVADRAKVCDWPVYVFYLYEDEVTLQERLYVLPAGARLDADGRVDRSGAIRCDDGQPVPKGFALGSDTVAFSVHARLPSIAKYGLPWYANADTAAEGFRQELGCAAVDDVEVTVRDTGDDSAEAFWFEAWVSPKLAGQLPQPPQETEEEEREARLTSAAYEKVFDKVFCELGCSTVQQVMDELAKCTPRTMLTAQAYLQRNVNPLIDLNIPYDRMPGSELFAHLRTMAKTEFEKLQAKG